MNSDHLAELIALADRVGGAAEYDVPDAPAVRAALSAYLAARDPAPDAAALVAITCALRALASSAAVADPVAGAASRDLGATVRTLASATGMSERAATARYPRATNTAP